MRCVLLLLAPMALASSAMAQTNGPQIDWTVRPEFGRPEDAAFATKPVELPKLGSSTAPLEVGRIRITPTVGEEALSPLLPPGYTDSDRFVRLELRAQADEDLEVWTSLAKRLKRHPKPTDSFLDRVPGDGPWLHERGLPKVRLGVTWKF